MNIYGMETKYTHFFSSLKRSTRLIFEWKLVSRTGNYFFFLWIISSSFLAMNPWTCHSNCAVDRAEYVCKIYAGDIWAHACGISWNEKEKKFFRSDSLQQCIATEIEVEWSLHAFFMHKFIILFIYKRYNLTLRCHLPFFVMRFSFLLHSHIYFVQFTIPDETYLSWGFPQSDWYFQASHCWEGATCQLYCLSLSFLRPFAPPIFEVNSAGRLELINLKY